MLNMKGIIILIIILSMALISVVAYIKGDNEKKALKAIEIKDGYNENFFKDASNYNEIKGKSLEELGAKEIGK